MKRILALTLILLVFCGIAQASRSPVATVSLILRGSDEEITNACRAAGSVSDTVVSPGGTFSFNACIGSRTEAAGYVSAADGSGTQVIGGGVDQTASALYMAVRNLDCVKIGKLSTYGGSYAKDYVQSSADAVRTDGKNDFSFANTGNAYLTVSMSVSNGVLNCAVYSD